MPQNLATLSLTDAETAALTAHLDGIETILGPRFVSLTLAQRQSLVKMGAKSRTFCEKAIPGIQSQAASLPPDLDLAALAGDLADYQKLEPFQTRFLTIGEKIDDTLKAVSSDVMTGAIIGVTFLKALNKLKPSLDVLLKNLQSVRRGTPPAKPPTPTP